MAVVIDIDHEAGNLGEYSSTTTDGGDLSVQAAAALASTSYGLQCVIDDTNTLRGQVGVTKATTFRLRLYVDPNSLSMATNDQFIYHYVLQSSGSYSTVVSLSLVKTVSSYRIGFNAYRDGGVAYSGNVDISDAPHYVEYQIVQAANSTSADGSYQWWVDGSSIASAANIDNYNLMSDQDWNARFGAEQFSVTATSGTFYLDEIKANNDGGEIGPVGGGAVDLTVQDASSVTSVESPALTQDHTLVIQDASSVTSADSPTLTQDHTLVVQDAASVTSADSITRFPGELFNIHMASNLSEWDSTVTDGGDLSWAAGAGLGGSSGGMSCLLDDTNELRAQIGITKSTTFRMRFYLDPNSLTMAENDAFTTAYVAQDGGSYGHIVEILLEKTASNYQLRVWAMRDSGSPAFIDTFAITDAPHYVEFKVVAATNSTSSDGTFEWWVDGASQGSAANIDNYNFMTDVNWMARLGFFAYIGAPTGTFYIDEIAANDSGLEIGPLASAITLTVQDASSVTSADSITRFPGELFNIHMETDLTEWTSTVTDGGDLSWSNDATAQAVAATSGAAKFVVDDTNAIYGEYDLATSSTTGKLRFRFYFDPNSLTMGASDGFYLATAYNSAGASICSFYISKPSGSFNIQPVIFLDSGNDWMGGFTITDAPHYIELYLQRATNSTSADGSLKLWVDGHTEVNVFYELTGQDNYDKFNDFDKLWIGGVSGLDAGTSGTFYIDEIAANDSGLEIGPLASAITLTVQDASSVTSADSPALTQIHTLTVQDASSITSVDSPTLTQAHTLVAQEASSITSVDSPTLTQAHTLTVADAASQTAADPLALTQVHILSVDDGSAVTYVENVSSEVAVRARVLWIMFETPPGTIRVVTGQDASAETSVDSVALTQIHQLVVQDASSETAADAIALTQVHVLTVQDAACETAADSPALTQTHVLTIQDASTVTSLDSPALTQLHLLVAQDASSVTTVDNVTTDQSQFLVVQDAASVTSLEGVTLAQVHNLTLLDASSVTSLDAVTLTQVHNLSAQDAASVTSVDAVVINSAANLTVQDAASVTAADRPTLTQVHALAVQDAASLTSVDAVVLARIFNLAVQDAASVTSLDSLTLAVAHNLAVQDASSITSLDAVVLVQIFVLSVQDASAVTFVDTVSVAGAFPPHLEGILVAGMRTWQPARFGGR